MSMRRHERAQRPTEPCGGPRDFTVQVNVIRNAGSRVRQGSNRNNPYVGPILCAVDTCAALHWNCVAALGPPRTVDSQEVEVTDSTGGPFGRFRERHYLLRVSDLPAVCRFYAECTEDPRTLRRSRYLFVSRGSRGSV